MKNFNSILKLLQKHEKNFYGTLGKYTGSDYTIDLHENAKAFPINIHKPTFKKE